MRFAFTFCYEELRALLYAVSQCMHRLESVSEYLQLFEFDNVEKIDFIADIMIYLECVYMQLQEDFKKATDCKGGVADEK